MSPKPPAFTSSAPEAFDAAAEKVVPEVFDAAAEKALVVAVVGAALVFATGAGACVSPKPPAFTSSEVDEPVAVVVGNAPLLLVGAG